MERLTRAALRHPGLTLAALVLATGGLGSGLLRLETHVGYRGFLGASHPEIRALDAFVDRFGGGLPAAIVWSCDDTPLCESVFDPAALRMARAVSSRLAIVDGVRHVESPATRALQIPTAFGIESRRFDEKAPLAERSAFAARALTDPSWVGHVVSADGRVGAIVIQHTSSDGQAAQRLLDTFRSALSPHESDGFRYRLVGPILELVLSERTLESDSRRVLPVMATLVLAVFYALFRSLRMAGLALLTAALAPLWAMGLCGWLGWPRNAVMQALPPVVLVIATCHGVHWLARTLSSAREPFRDERLLSVAREIGRPCVMTSATTAAGFLSFATSGVESFVRFGVIAAFGVGAALLLTFTGLPVLLRKSPPPAAHLARVSDGWDRVLRSLVATTTRRRRAVAVGALLFGVVSLLGLLRLRVDVHPYELVGEDSEVVAWARFAEQHLRKPDKLEVELTLPSDASLVAPETLAAIERAAQELDRVEGLGPVRSIVDWLRLANRLLHGDDPSRATLGDTERANAELLLLLSLQAEDALRPWVTLDRRRVRLSVEARMESQRSQQTKIEQAEQRLSDALGPRWEARLNGPLWVRHALVGEIQRTQLRSFAAAGLAVFVLLALFLGSLAWAALAMLPNLLPVALTLGTMGLADIPLDIGSAMVAAVVLGIAVDDTIYLLSHYRTLREQGFDPVESIQGAVHHVGRAITTTTVALALGFLALTLSHLDSIAHFGLLAGVAILAAWVADVVLLPVLILWAARWRAQSGSFLG